MKVHFKEVEVSTKESFELMDITEQVSSFVRECKVQSGICLINSIHSTTAIIVNEHESGLIRDILSKIEEEFPKDKRWNHNRIDNNAEAHLASTFLGHSKIFPVKNGKLRRGTWQNIFLLELDGPRNRQIVFEVIGV
jgi:secondary thiamine-phosphate synthase enzyme